MANPKNKAPLVRQSSLAKLGITSRSFNPPDFVIPQEFGPGSFGVEPSKRVVSGHGIASDGVSVSNLAAINHLIQTSGVLKQNPDYHFDQENKLHVMQKIKSLRKLAERAVKLKAEKVAQQKMTERTLQLKVEQREQELKEAQQLKQKIIDQQRKKREMRALYEKEKKEIHEQVLKSRQELRNSIRLADTTRRTDNKKAHQAVVEESKRIRDSIRISREGELQKKRQQRNEFHTTRRDFMSRTMQQRWDAMKKAHEDYMKRIQKEKDTTQEANAKIAGLSREELDVLQRVTDMTNKYKATRLKAEELSRRRLALTSTIPGTTISRPASAPSYHTVRPSLTHLKLLTSAHSNLGATFA